MSMHHDWIVLGRAYRAQIDRETESLLASIEIRRRRSPRLYRLLARLLVRLGSAMLSLGRRLECYQWRLLGQARR